MDPPLFTTYGLDVPPIRDDACGRHLDRGLLTAVRSGRGVAVLAGPAMLRKEVVEGVDKFG